MHHPMNFVLLTLTDYHFLYKIIILLVLLLPVVRCYRTKIKLQTKLVNKKDFKWESHQNGTISYYFCYFFFNSLKKMGNFAILLFHYDASLGLRSHKHTIRQQKCFAWGRPVKWKNTLFRLSRFIFFIYLFAAFNLSILLCVRISFIFSHCVLDMDD